MTANQLLDYQISQSGRQVEACLSGMTSEAFESKTNGMSPQEILIHLSEAYQAFLTVAKGEKHNWGSFVVADRSMSAVLDIFRNLRQEAAELAASTGEEAVIKEGYDYVVAHDNYHVGQLVLSRLQSEPGWDAYSIYS